MKNFLFAFPLFISFVSQNCLAQQDKIFVDAQGNKSLKDSAIFYTVFEKTNDTSYTVSSFYKNQKRRMLAHLASTNLSVMSGDAVYYDSLGNTIQCGKYEKGYAIGEWKYYYQGSNFLKEKRQYKNHDEYCVQFFDSSTHQLEEEGCMDLYKKKTGSWMTYFYHSDSIKKRSNYVLGKHEGEQIEYYKNGKIKRKEIFKNNKLKKAWQFDEDGKKIKYTPAFTYPKSSTSGYYYLKKKNSCMLELLGKGELLITFILSKDGKVKNVELPTIQACSCKEDIILSILKMKKWKPAKREGEAIDFNMEIHLH